jgi:hypothetical protein
MAKNIKAKMVTKPTGNKKLNKAAVVSKSASVKFTGPKSTAPKGAIPSKKMGGSSKSKMC